jgi:hypothetical protein
LSVHDEDGQLPGSEPEWDDVDICAIGEVWNVVEDAIEEKCKIANFAQAKAICPSVPARTSTPTPAGSGSNL